LRGLRTRKFRMVAVLAASAMIATACSDSGSGTGDDETSDGGTETETTTETETDAGGGSTESFVYRTGIFEDTTTDNFWAYYGPDASTWNGYVIGSTKAALYGVDYPDLVISPSLAAEDFPEPVEEDGKFTVTVPMKEGLVWSDGDDLTAEDVAFTVNTVKDLGLGGNWLAAYPLASEDAPDTVGLESAEAVDATTVKFTFNLRPGLGIWPNSVGLAPVMAKHFWEEKVEAAKGSDDPAATLYAESGAEDPSSGPYVFDESEEGAFARVVANENYNSSGREVSFESNGGGTFTEGPYASEVVYSLYGGQDQAVLALKEGEIDFLFNPSGMQRGLREQVTGDENLTAVTNAANGFRYLAFNMRRAPMSDLAFRKAVATMIDREFMASSVLQGAAIPLFTFTPQGNASWYDQAKAEELKQPYVGFDNQAARAQAAVDILKEAGYTWDTEPVIDIEADEVTAGAGITQPDGTKVPAMELLAPGPGYDPLRSTYAVWVQQWAQDLGIPLTANPTDFNTIVEQAFSAEAEWDMYMLGWGLGSPTFPSFAESFFHSRNDSTQGGFNTPGYADDEFDAGADAFLAATSEEEAKDILWSTLEPKLAEDLPYVVLFTTPILEFYRSGSIDYPFESMLDGIQNLNGMPELVRTAN
jgi:peptide/nickel transport system substrate-binding protein